MNIDFANSIPMPKILEKIGLRPLEQQPQGLIYPSPLHAESTAFLHVSTTDNTWHDTGMNVSGNVIDFVREWLRSRNERCSIGDVLHWLKFNIGYPSLFEMTGLPDTRPADEKYQFKAKTLLLERGLVRYVESQGVPVALARKYLKQVYVLNTLTGKKKVAVGIRNEEGGYAVRSPLLNACTAPAAVTIIHGRIRGLNRIQIFYDMFDYLRALKQREGNRFDEDSIILHTYVCIDNAAAYIRGFRYRKLYTWFDDSEAGRALTKACAFLCSTEERLTHQPIYVAQQ